MKKIILILLLATCFYSVFPQNYTKSQWIEDFDFVVSKLKENHPNVYYRFSEEDFLQAISHTKKEIIEASSDVSSYFAIKKFVANIQDGHTSLTDGGVFGLKNKLFPFRAEKFSEGVFLTAVHNDFKKYFGSKVVKINGRPTSEVLKFLLPFVNSDNEFGKFYTTTYYLSFPKILNALGIIDEASKIKFQVETKDGNTEDVIFNSIEAYSAGDWHSIVEEFGDKLPLHQKHDYIDKRYYWFEHLENDSALYFQYNSVGNQDGYVETWYQFNNRIWNYIDSHSNEINKLIIDLRYNSGGSGRTMYPFINQVINHNKFSEGRNLFVLMGENTFSAPVIFINELKVHTDAVFIGAPPAHPFNFFSNRRYVGSAPNSGIRLSIASRQIDNAWCQERDYFCPDIPAPLSGSDYFTGNDTALKTALNYAENMSIKDFAIEHGAEKAFEHFQIQKEMYKNYRWWVGFNPEILEFNMNQEAYKLVYSYRMDEALPLLKLNSLLFPESYNTWDSLAEWYYLSGDFDKAKIYYQKSCDINPGNKRAAKIIQEIKKMEYSSN